MKDVFESITLASGVKIRIGTTLLCRESMTYGRRDRSGDVTFHAGDVYEVEGIEWVPSDSCVAVAFRNDDPFSLLDLAALEDHIENGELAVVTPLEE